MITGSDVDEWPGRKGQGVERVGWSLDKEQETIDNISKPIKSNQLFSFDYHSSKIVQTISRVLLSQIKK